LPQKRLPALFPQAAKCPKILPKFSQKTPQISSKKPAQKKRSFFLSNLMRKKRGE